MIVENDDEKKFDPDLSPGSEHNRDVAKENHLIYDAVKRVYRDSDGCPVRDRFGQPLG